MHNIKHKTFTLRAKSNYEIERRVFTFDALCLDELQRVDTIPICPHA